MSAKYESGGRGPGIIANNRGDIGGASYGTYQIATNTGTMKNFMNYLKNNHPSFHKSLGPYKPGTSGFNTRWKQLANQNPAAFEKAQHNFIKSSHYDPARNKIKNSLGIDIDKHSKAVRDVLWSTSVQHGSGGASTIFKRALGKNPRGLSDAEIIRRVYAERMANNGRKYFSSSSPDVRKSVVNRFRNELKDALSMLR